VLLAKTVAAESHCRARVVNKRSGAVGLGQILPCRSADRDCHTVEELKGIELNLDLTAAHLARCLAHCRGRVSGAVAVYNGARRCQPTAWSRWVLHGMWQAKLKHRRR
jgi:hypothetical protein